MKKLLHLLLCALMILSLAGCSKSPQKQLEEFLKQQSANNYTSGEVTGSASISANGLQQIPISLDMKYDTSKHSAQAEISMMGMMNGTVTIVERTAYIDFMNMKYKVVMDNKTTGVSVTTNGGFGLDQFFKAITNVTVTSRNGETIYSFDINMTGLMDMLPKQQVTDQMKQTFKNNPHVSLTGDKNNNLKHAQLTWNFNNTTSMTGEFDFKNLGKPVDINEPADKDMYQEINPEDISSQFQQS